LRDIRFELILNSTIMNFAYWDNFINVWSTLPSYTSLSSIALPGGWMNPNLPPTPLYNSGTSGILSNEFLPEPYWGNNGSSPLEAVVINFNPASAINLQHHSKIVRTLSSLGGYSSLIKNECTTHPGSLPLTNNWHYNRRAKPLFDTLGSLGFSLKGIGLCNYLGIELAPWHTSNYSIIKNYVISNINAVFNNSIAFAANESLRISNTKLKNKVVIKSNDINILSLLKHISSAGLSAYSPLKSGTSPSGNGKYFSFTLSSFPNVKFVCIWGPTSRNNFPPIIDLKWIINII